MDNLIVSLVHGWNRLWCL